MQVDAAKDEIQTIGDADVRRRPAPVDLLTDTYGLTHIYAESEQDLFFAQGYNAARARLWQIDLWRRRGLGELAEVLGFGFVAQDRVNRTFLYRGDMDAEWHAYPANTKAACESFCGGINAYLAKLDRNEVPLPREFETLGFRPARWSPRDIVSIRNNTLTGNAISELQRCMLRQVGRDDVDALRSILRPSPPDARAPCHIENCAELITFMELAVAPVIITRERLKADRTEIEAWADPSRFLSAFSITKNSTASCEGSNNWALSGARTESGYPIVANDPHRALQTPSLRYAVHLCCPAFSIIGGGEPALPGISIGHNGSVAFGLTIFPADQEDVFAFDFGGNSDDAQSQLKEYVSTIAVRGGESIACKTYCFAASPVIRFDLETRSGIAVRTVWSEPGAAPYLGSLALATARDVADFRSRLATWRLPAVNYVAADKDGSIGWFVAGAVPSRRAGSGVVPERCDGDPWDGFLPNGCLPMSIDPPRGYVMSANEFNQPDDWDQTSPLSYEWYENYRARRIHTRLGGVGRATVAQSLDLQNDVVSVAATDLLSRLRAAFEETALRGRPRCTHEFLLWGGTIDNNLRVTRFFHHWLRLLKSDVVVLFGGEHCRPVDKSTEAIVAALDGMPIVQATEVLLKALDVAERDAETGALDKLPARRALFRHAIQDDVEAQHSFHDGPMPWKGDDTTVHLGRNGSDPQFIEAGASFRVVMDVADWDKSRWQNVPDQSVGGMVPLLYSKTLIEASLDSRLRLLPSLKGAKP